jgi:hypothetical protein
MAPGDRHTIFHAHQLGKHLGTGDDRDLAGFGCHHFDVRCGHCRRHHDYIGLCHILRLVPCAVAHPKPRQSTGNLRVGEVGAANGIAQIV